jgi:hypothetical protein
MEWQTPKQFPGVYRQTISNFAKDLCRTETGEMMTERLIEILETVLAMLKDSEYQHFVPAENVAATSPESPSVAAGEKLHRDTGLIPAVLTMAESALPDLKSPLAQSSKSPELERLELLIGAARSRGDVSTFIRGAIDRLMKEPMNSA